MVAEEQLEGFYGIVLRVQITKHSVAFLAQRAEGDKMKNVFIIQHNTAGCICMFSYMQH